ncbi:hypothetical protein ACFLVN_04185 [Chloroflexota bacterium]
MKRRLLSKSKYLTGIQCPKLLWVQINDPKRLPQIDLVTRFIFDQGHLVGELAKKLFPEGMDVPNDGFMENIAATGKLLNERIPLFEAGILADRIYSRVDILRPAMEVPFEKAFSDQEMQELLSKWETVCESDESSCTHHWHNKGNNVFR